MFTKLLIFQEYWVEKTIEIVPKTESRNFYNLDPSRFSMSFSPYFVTFVPCNVSTSNFLILLDYSTKKQYVPSMKWNPEGPEMAESALGLDLVRYSNLIILALATSFSVKKSIDGFLLEADYSFLNKKEFFWNPDWPKLAKCYSFWDISIFQLVLFENYTFEIFIKVWYDSDWSSSVCQIAELVILSLTLEFWGAEHVILSDYFSYFVDFRLIKIWSYRLEFSRRSLYRSLLWQHWVIFRSDLLFVCSIFYCATLTENIAVRFRLLFFCSCLQWITDDTRISKTAVIGDKSKVSKKVRLLSRLSVSQSPSLYDKFMYQWYFLWFLSFMRILLWIIWKTCRC